MSYGPVNVPGKLTAAQVGAAEAGHTHTAAQVGASPVGHKHTKNEITDFPASLPASDVSAWAKAATKPAYTASEVGAAEAGHTHSAADVGAAPIKNATFTGITTVDRLNVGRNNPSSVWSESIAIGMDAKTKSWSLAINGETTGNTAIACGTMAVANNGQLVIGSYNLSVEGDDYTYFIVGGGNGNFARANAFRVTGQGNVYAGKYNTSGADYAELFEWADGNPDNDDRVGRFVTLDGDKIRIANGNDNFILGILSGNPSIIGDVYDDQWQGMFLRDIFGRPILELKDIPLNTPEGETTVQRYMMKLNPDYDHNQAYVPRTKRSEWGCVGLMGKLVVIDDGTCQVNGWAAVAEGGIATASAERTKFRVMERLDRDGGHYIRVLVL